MGKRIAFSIVLAGMSFSTIITLAVSAGSAIYSVSRFWGQKTLAQEMPSLALQSSASVDSVIAKTVISAQKNAIQKISVWATAYSSEPSQTDETPLITASGAMVHDGVAAANFLPLGTQFTIPHLFGDKVFTVEDRMNSRYNNTKTIDLWFPQTDTALEFGRRAISIHVL